MAEKFACPKCGSSDIQKCSVIYQSGTVDHSYTSRSGDNTVETSGTESTALAQSVAPPAKKDDSWGSTIACFVIGAILFACEFHIVALIFGVAGIGNFMSAQEAGKYNSERWPQEYKAWQHSWFCRRCGHCFIMD